MHQRWGFGWFFQEKGHLTITQLKPISASRILYIQKTEKICIVMSVLFKTVQAMPGVGTRERSTVKKG